MAVFLYFYHERASHGYKVATLFLILAGFIMSGCGGTPGLATGSTWIDLDTPQNAPSETGTTSPTVTGLSNAK